MAISFRVTPNWLTDWMGSKKILLWGAADLRHIYTPKDEAGRRFPFAVSLVVPMNPLIIIKTKEGPNQEYADEYTRVNCLIDELSLSLQDEIRNRGFRSKALAASQRTDTDNFQGDFPHKTAATIAGLGWIGRHCQLVTRPFGSWIRLGTIFTDVELDCASPIVRNFCGNCMRCVESCPAKALKGKAWNPDVPRDEILDVMACDQWKKTHYFQFNKGHNCGICSAVCPYGLKVLKRKIARKQR